MNKLVRDKIVDIIQKSGRTVNHVKLNDADYEVALKNKLQEESLEVIAAKNQKETVEELADLQELIDCLLVHINVSKEELQKAQEAKNQAKGSFKDKIFIKS